MITLPNDWDLRPHQRDAWFRLTDSPDRQRLYLVWHRRAGKDSFAINATAYVSQFGVPGTYWHLLPTQVQARKVVWNGIDGQGRRIIDQAFPPAMRDGKANSQEMLIRTKRGSVWQLAGSDNYNSLVGANVRGVVFSEWAVCDPASWDYIRPIIRENKGWAIFITTPRGRNHAWRMFETLKSNPRWLVELRTVADTKREDGSPVITERDLDEEREDGMSEEMIDQEYNCSFAAGVVGSYYGREMERARIEDRIGKLKWDRMLPVHTYWDLGIDDATAIWYGQRKGFERRWIAYEEFTDTPLLDIYEHVAAKPYRYAFHHMPHDIAQREMTSGRSRLEFAEEVLEGRGDVVVVPQHSVDDGIEATRYLIGQSWFDEEHCQRGIDALLNYRKVWNEKTASYQLKPLHDWSSHAADAFRQAGWMDADEPAHEGIDAYTGTHRVRVHRSI